MNVKKIATIGAAALALASCETQEAQNRTLFQETAKQLEEERAIESQASDTQTQVEANIEPLSPEAEKTAAIIKKGCEINTKRVKSMYQVLWNIDTTDINVKDISQLVGMIPLLNGTNMNNPELLNYFRIERDGKILEGNGADLLNKLGDLTEDELKEIQHTFENSDLYAFEDSLARFSSITSGGYDIEEAEKYNKIIDENKNLTNKQKVKQIQNLVKFLQELEKKGEGIGERISSMRARLKRVTYTGTIDSVAAKNSDSIREYNYRIDDNDHILESTEFFEQQLEYLTKLAEATECFLAEKIPTNEQREIFEQLENDPEKTLRSVAWMISLTRY